MTIDLRLIVPAASAWLVSALVVAVPHAAAGFSLAAWTIAGVMTVLLATLVLSGSARRRGSLARLVRAVRIGWTGAALAIVSAALALTAVAIDAPRRSPAGLQAAVLSGDQVTLTVRIDSAARAISAGFDGGRRWMWEGTAESARIDSDETRLDVPVSVIAAMPTDRVRTIALGSVIDVTGGVRATDPGSATSFVVMAGDSARIRERPPWWTAWATPLRDGFARAATHLPGDGAALLPGLSIGDVTAVDSGLDEAMKSSALSHLTAVSGANCALVTGLVFLGCAVLGFGRRTRVVVALLALSGFVVLVMPGASVVRAAAMAVVVLIALARGRPIGGIPVLGLAVLLLLIHDPWVSRDYGFALSVLATAGLLTLSGPLSQIFERWMPRALAVVLAVPLAAQLACQPVLLMLAPSPPLYGVAANLLAEPAAPLGTAVGLLACLALPIAPHLGEALAWLAWLPAAWIAAIARWAVEAPASSLPWPEGAVGVALCIAATVAIGVLVFATTRRREPRTFPARVTTGLLGFTLIVGAGIYAGSLGGDRIGRELGIPDDWQIAACDVGQGDGLLVRDGGHVAMIDVGREPAPAAACLERLGVDRIELLVLTHYDADHVGGVSAVTGLTSSAIVGETARDSDEKTLGTLRAAGVRIGTGTAGMVGTLGALRWRILWPPAPTGGRSILTGNAGSVAIEFEGNGMRSVFLGDLGEEAQDSMLALDGIRAVDVVKLAHHGSADQSESLYQRLGAALALVSVGDENGYGHPTSKALDMLARAGTAIARTDRQGLILVSPGATPGTISVWSERQVTSHSSNGSPESGDDGGRPYAGSDGGDQWQHEPAARPTRARGGPRRRPFLNSPGTRCARRPWCSYREPRSFWQRGRSARCERFSKRKIRVSRSVTSRRTTTRQVSCSHSRAPPCSASRV